MVRDGHFLYSYGDHVSTYGGDLIAAGLQPVLQSLSQPGAVAADPATYSK